MTQPGQLKFLDKVFGATAGVRLLPVIEGVDKLRDINLPQVREIVRENPLDVDLKTNEATYASSMLKFSQSIQNVKEALGTALLPGLTRLVDLLTGAANWFRVFAGNHPTLIKFALGFVAVAGAIALVGGVILPLLGTITLVGGALGATAGVAVAWGLGIAAAIAAIGGLVFALWPQVKTFFTQMIPQAFEWGANILKTLAKGIESAALWPIHALENVLKRMRGFLPFSPAREGPLQDLHRIRIVETIAASMRPAPMVAAMHRVGMAAMVAAPLMFGAGAGTASAGGAPAPMVINYAPVINGATSPDEWVKAARKHADELMHITEAKTGRRDRRAF
jgi:hypothetical protein